MMGYAVEIGVWDDVWGAEPDVRRSDVNNLDGHQRKMAELLEEPGDYIEYHDYSENRKIGIERLLTEPI